MIYSYGVRIQVFPNAFCVQTRIAPIICCKPLMNRYVFDMEVLVYTQCLYECYDYSIYIAVTRTVIILAVRVSQTTCRAIINKINVQTST